LGRKTITRNRKIIRAQQINGLKETRNRDALIA